MEHGDRRIRPGGRGDTAPLAGLAWTLREVWFGEGRPTRIAAGSVLKCDTAAERQ
nr:hypothetical protein Ade03nite_56050 [Actinoplanes derwentensis]